ncbi:hypothetical protein B5P44_00575 [Mycobacterium sp. CBMA 213]|uniref:Helicase ATP-binding domain-containing protein n=1 Tax=Mycolicibacterium sp. CBMA 213 TaxID=1968788 RepID=A0A343VR98_9MYCO|nr:MULTISPECIES: DEAD/DEAH box helicase [unclassified Mycolicibacterium]AVN58422.1 hypothetical protein B5P44_p00127 [Mycolicibacterium sp. CBMA 213]MUL61080.1 DEAD/DEAH box helicase [Mycolicibacterium sp. CBMA 335]MUM03318.1 hypothetical protein [Mycolicibacterium sp. CBMA 213]
MTTIDNSYWPLLHEAVAGLAAVCDYAEAKDAAGFSATDAAIGHYLAEVPVTEWTTEHASAARSLLPTYRRQLGDALTNKIRALPDPAADEVAHARTHVRGLHRAERERQYRKRQSYVHVEDERVRLAFPYDAELVAKAKVIPGRRYDGQTRTNTYPLSSLPAVVGFATAAGIDIAPEVLAVARDVALNPQAYRPPNVTLAPGNPEAVRIDADYDVELNQALRSLNGGSTWLSSERVHQVSIAAGAARLLDLFADKQLTVTDDAREALTAAVEVQRTQPAGTAELAEAGMLIIAPLMPTAATAVLARLRGLAGSSVSRKQLLPWPIRVEPAEVMAALDEHGFVVDADARAALAAESARQAVNLVVSAARTAEAVAVEGLGVTLMDHQHAGVRFCLGSRRLIVGDDMGLGKTITSLAAVAADAAFPCVVACKPDLTENWRNEVARALPGRAVAVAAGMTATDLPADVDVVIIGYAALGTKAKGSQRGNERFAWVEQLTALRPRSLVIDEGHLGKEVTAARSRALAALGAYVAARDGLILNLTGTPLVNRPRELAQQLITLGLLAPKDEEIDPQRHLFGGEWDFLFRYCGPERSAGGYGWTFNGASNTAELHHRLRAWGVLLRRTENALSLPPFTIEELPVADSDLDPAALAEYREAEEKAASDFAREAMGLADSYGCDVTDARVWSAMAGRAGDHLVRLNSLRQLIGAAKQPAVTRWTQEQITGGEKVMIAAHHRDVVNHYAQEFGGLKIQGGQTVAAKEADKARFQTEPIDVAPAITVSIGAGGVGHTLTAARLGVQAELCWTPGDLRQMAKRIHRIGQQRPVTYFVAVAGGTIDDKMWSMITSKQAVLDAVIDGIEATAADEEVASAALLARELAEAGLRRLASDIDEPATA